MNASNLRLVYEENHRVRVSVVERAARIDALSIDRSHLLALQKHFWPVCCPAFDKHEARLSEYRERASTADKIEALRVLSHAKL